MAEGTLETKQLYKLLQLVHQQNEKEVVKMVHNGVPDLINLTEPNDGYSALHMVSMVNNVEMAEVLLTLNAHPDIQNLMGQTPLMICAEKGYVDMVKLLTNYQASVKFLDKEGRGVLFYCIGPTDMHRQIQEIIMSTDIDVTNVSNSGKSAFLFACEHAKDCEDLCMQLIERGADPNAADPETKNTPLMAAIKSGSVALVRAILQKGGNPDAVDKQQLHAAHFAATGGFVEMLSLLSAYAADFNMVSLFENTALHAAAAEGHDVCCRFLIQRGCNVMTKNQLKLSASQVAKQNRCKAALKELKAAEKAQKSGKLKPLIDPARLHDWSLEHKEELTRAFQPEEEASPFIPEETFLSVLQAHHAPVTNETLQTIYNNFVGKQRGEINIDDFFTGNGFLPKKYQLSTFLPKVKKSKTRSRKIYKTDKEKSPQSPDVMDPEEDTGPFSHERTPDPSLFFDSMDVYININKCLRKNDFETLRLAFSQKIPVDIRDNLYKTPLMNACISGNYEMARFLIEHGANVNTHDQLRWSNLHHACLGGHTDIVKLLLEHGAVVDARTTNDVTPLMRAIQSCQLSCVDLLIKSDANVMATDKHGQSCLFLAEKSGNAQIETLLKNAPKQSEENEDPPEPPEMEKGSPSETAKGCMVALNPTAADQCITLPSKTIWGEKVVTTLKLKRRIEERHVHFAEDIMTVLDESEINSQISLSSTAGPSKTPKRSPSKRKQ
ncbi:ankyrin repeat and EF-hand domain-containing protein 1 [Silurus meridionalis]|nr:ankyrin repeat and EF-hand domain-containing protein 1 [Silurus meridionalis]